MRSENNVEHTREKPHLECAPPKYIDVEGQGLRIFMISKQKNR